MAVGVGLNGTASRNHRLLGRGCLFASKLWSWHQSYCVGCVYKVACSNHPVIEKRVGWKQARAEKPKFDSLGEFPPTCDYYGNPSMQFHLAECSMKLCQLDGNPLDRFGSLAAHQSGLMLKRNHALGSSIHPQEGVLHLNGQVSNLFEYLPSFPSWSSTSLAISPLTALHTPQIWSDPDSLWI